jgi:hypothetical protein
MERGMEFELMLAQIKLPESAGQRDWPKVLSAIRSKLDVIVRHPRIAADDKCQAIIAAMAESGDMPAFALLVDELAHRIAWLFRSGGDDIDWVLRGSSKSAARRRLKSVNEPDFDDGSTASPADRSRRTQLRL